MRLVQALQWLRSTIDSDYNRISRRLTAILADPDHGAAIAADLRDGFTTLPDWMQTFLKPLLERPSPAVPETKPPKHQKKGQR
jgi:hypothetical protein